MSRANFLTKQAPAMIEALDCISNPVERANALKILNTLVPKAYSGCLSGEVKEKVSRGHDIKQPRSLQMQCQALAKKETGEKVENPVEWYETNHKKEFKAMKAKFTTELAIFVKAEREINPLKDSPDHFWNPETNRYNAKKKPSVKKNPTRAARKPAIVEKPLEFPEDEPKEEIDEDYGSESE